MRVVLALLLASCCVTARAQPGDTLAAVVPLPVTFSDARAVAADPLGRLFVADAGADVLVQVDPSGMVLATLGGPGTEPGTFDDPSDLDPTNGLTLLVADAGNGRVQRFSRHFAFLGAWQVEEAGRAAARVARAGLGRPVAVRAGVAGETLALDADARLVVRWDRAGRRMAALGDAHAGSGRLLDPVALAVDDEGRVFVADRGREAIVVFDALGAPAGVFLEGRARQVRALEWIEGRLWLVFAFELGVVHPQGQLERVVAVPLAEEMVDIAFLAGQLYLLTARGLHRADLP